MATYLSNPEQEAKEYMPRYRWLYGLVAVSFFIIFCRLWYLQIIRGSILREFSEKNRIKETSITAPRGVILDRNGAVLVDNLPGFVTTISPQYAKNLTETAETVSKILKIPADKIVRTVTRSKFQNGPFFPVKIKDNLSLEEVFQLKLVRLNNPGLEVTETIVRNYPLEGNGAQLFGYVGEISKRQLPILNGTRKPDQDLFRQGDIIGKSGLEQSYDEELRGHDGVSFLEVDARGRELSRGNTNVTRVLGAITRFRPSDPGYNIQLTIDKDVQEAAFKALNGTGRIGSLVAVTPQGEVISWVNSPSYNPNEFATGISNELWQQLVNDRFRPMINKAIQDHHSPGSTFKPIVAIAALQEKAISPQTTFFCPGYFQFGRKRYHCGAEKGHGRVNIFQALERSCNVFFYKLGSQLGIDKIAKYATAFGIGNKSGIELLNEVPGLMPTTEWKKQNRGEEWQPGENLSNAIGQGYILTTPLQMALAYSAIGTNGLLFKPYVVKKITGPDGQVLNENFPLQVSVLNSTSKGPVTVSDENFAIVREGMRLVVNGANGTARASQIREVQMAGKTGTSQLFSFSADQVYSKCINKPLTQRHHGWFVGFAPFDRPVITVAVLAEHGCSGSGGAAPVVKEVVHAYLKKYHPELLAAPPKNAPKNSPTNLVKPPESDEET